MNLLDDAKDWLEERFGRDVEPDLDLFESGILDSLSFNELVSHLEELAGMELDFGQVSDWRHLSTLRGIEREFHRQL